MGVAEELSHLQGVASAAALLARAGEWVSAIDEKTERRTARLAFAVAQFNLNAYEGGVVTLRHELDPVWSSDMMLALAAPASATNSDEQRAGYASAMGAPAAVTRKEEGSFNAARYGVSLDYKQVFQGNAQSVRR